MNEKKYNIAILGATSHIAKGLTYRYLNDSPFRVDLYARNTKAVETFLSDWNISGEYSICDVNEFSKSEYTAVINCIGFGSPKNAKNIGSNILRITEQYDNLILDYLENTRTSIYINFSSGAVYGKQFLEPADKDTYARIQVNSLDDSDYYTISKINAESKHRALNHLNIIDIRIFSYFSRFIDLDSGFLITEILSSIINNTIFKTNPNNIMRDYITVDDLFLLINHCIDNPSNMSIDAYSLSPVSKMDIISAFNEKYNLIHVIDDKLKIHNLIGEKPNYYTTFCKASCLGYKPTLSSIQGIMKETESLMHHIGYGATNDQCKN